MRKMICTILSAILLTGTFACDGFSSPGTDGGTGATGTTGPNGATGAMGPEGVMGPTGNAGPQGLAGVQGPQGPQGNPGQNGTQGPQGLQGPAGPQGPAGVGGGATGATGAPGLTWRGAWNSTSVYNIGDAVSEYGSSYVSVIENNTEAVTTTAWALLAQGGVNGTNGVTGATGSQGLTGARGATGATGPAGNPPSFTTLPATIVECPNGTGGQALYVNGVYLTSICNGPTGTTMGSIPAGYVCLEFGNTNTMYTNPVVEVWTTNPPMLVPLPQTDVFCETAQQAQTSYLLSDGTTKVATKVHVNGLGYVALPAGNGADFGCGSNPPMTTITVKIWGNGVGYSVIVGEILADPDTICVGGDLYIDWTNVQPFVTLVPATHL